MSDIKVDYEIGKSLKYDGVGERIIVDQNELNHATINFGKFVDQNRNDMIVTYLTSFNSPYITRIAGSASVSAGRQMNHFVSQPMQAKMPACFAVAALTPRLQGTAAKDGT